MEMAVRFPNLGIRLDHVGKLVEIRGFQISIFGILLAVGMLLASFYVVMLAKRTGQNQNFCLGAVIVSAAGAVIGARLGYVLFYPELVNTDFTQLWNLRDGGFLLYGGLLGGCLFLLIYCKIAKAAFWQTADILSMGVLIVQIIGKWGNFFNRECLGDYTENLFAMQLPVDAVRQGEITEQMASHMEAIDGTFFVQMHPVFLYESLWCAGLFLLLSWYRRHKKFKGEIFLAYVLGYSAGRLWMEPLRTDQVLLPGTSFSASMLIAGILTVICFSYIIVGRRMAVMRKEARRRRQEAGYQAEEQAFGERPKEGPSLPREPDEPPAEEIPETPEAAPGNGETEETEKDEDGETGDQVPDLLEQEAQFYVPADRDPEQEDFYSTK